MKNLIKVSAISLIAFTLMLGSVGSAAAGSKRVGYKVAKKTYQSPRQLRLQNRNVGIIGMNIIGMNKVMAPKSSARQLKLQKRSAPSIVHMNGITQTNRVVHMNGLTPQRYGVIHMNGLIPQRNGVVHMNGLIPQRR